MQSYREFIDKLHNEADIVSIVGDYIELKKAGANYKGLCPFHKEKTPSFNVSPVKNIWHCFGCGKGGDVIGFVKEIEHVEFRQAIEIISRKTGIPLPSFRPIEQERTEEKERALHLEINVLAADMFTKALRDADLGREARAYLEKRGIDEDIIEKFKLGYAPESGQYLTRAGQKKGYSPQTLEKAGVVMQREGRSFDRFRNRVMFSIADPVGNVVGFGGRVLDKSDPKYINSPETMLYKKSRLLYGLHLAKEAIREFGYAILMEGYLDVIAAHQFGFPNTVASLGTALTDDQARLLKRSAEQVVFIYDPDEAGRKAMLTGCEVLLRQEFSIKIVVLPDNLDPDDFIRSRGPDAFRKEIEQAGDFFEFLVRVASDLYDLQEIDGKIQAIDLIGPVLRNVRNEIRKADYHRRLSEAIGLPEDIVRRYMRDSHIERGELRTQIEERGVGRAASVERGLLKMMLESTASRSFIKSSDFNPEWIEDTGVQEWLKKLSDYDGDLNFSDLLESCNEEEGRLLRQILFWEEQVQEDEMFLSQISQRLKIRYLGKRTRQLRNEIADLYAKDPNSNLSELLVAVQRESRKKLEEMKKMENFKYLSSL